MRVALLDRGIIPYTIELANALAEHHTLSLLVPGRKYADRVWAINEKVDLHLLDWPRLRDPRNLLFLVKLKRLIEGLNPDVVHFQDTQVWLNRLFHTLRGRPFVTTVHDVVPHPGDAPSQKIPTCVARRTLEKTDRVIAHGQELKRKITDVAGVPPDRIDVIPHGVLNLYHRASAQSSAQSPSAPAHPEVLFFGRIYEYKGLEYLIRAQPAITRACPGARIVIAGSGEDFARYRNMLADPDKFEILNRFIPDAEVAALFTRATVVAVPYVEGSQSGVVQVAFAFGKPVVATSVGSIPEAVDDGRAGILVPPRDVDALASAIVELLADSERRRTMQDYIEHQAATRFSWNTIAESTAQTYERAIRTKALERGVGRMSVYGL